MNILNNIPIAEGKTDTSRRAALAVKGSAHNIRGHVLQILSKVGPLTDDELSDQLGIPIISVRPRVSKMRKVGLLEPL
jgi:predicted transcriptional regulator